MAIRLSPGMLHLAVRCTLLHSEYGHIHSQSYPYRPLHDRVWNSPCNGAFGCAAVVCM